MRNVVRLNPKNIYITASALNNKAAYSSAFPIMAGGTFLTMAPIDFSNLINNASGVLPNPTAKIILHGITCHYTITNLTSYRQFYNLFYWEAREDVPTSEWSNAANMFSQPYDNYAGGSSTTTWDNYGMTPFDNPVVTKMLKITKVSKLVLYAGRSKNWTKYYKFDKTLNIAEYTNPTAMANNFVVQKGLGKGLWIQCIGDVTVDKNIHANVNMNPGNLTATVIEKYKYNIFDLTGYNYVAAVGPGIAAITQANSSVVNDPVFAVGLPVFPPYSAT